MRKYLLLICWPCATYSYATTSLKIETIHISTDSTKHNTDRSRAINDIDQDNIPNDTDLDDDNDGIPDAIECLFSSPVAQTPASIAVNWVDGTTTVFAYGETQDATGYQKSDFEKYLIDNTIPYTHLNNNYDFTVLAGTNEKDNIIKFVDGELTYEGTGAFVDPKKFNEKSGSSQSQFILGSSGDAAYCRVLGLGDTGDKIDVTIHLNQSVITFGFDLVDPFEIDTAEDQNVKYNFYINNQLAAIIDGHNGSYGSFKIHNSQGVFQGEVTMGDARETSLGFVSAPPFSNIKIEAVLKAIDYYNDAVGIDNFMYSAMGICDLDQDGIPNHWDLDTDGDDCFDAIEGDENVHFSHLNANGSINVGNTSPFAIDLDGVPNLVNSGGSADIGNDQGQGLGNSQNATNNPCNCSLIDSNRNISRQPINRER